MAGAVQGAPGDRGPAAVKHVILTCAEVLVGSGGVPRGFHTIKPGGYDKINDTCLNFWRNIVLLH